MSPPKVFVALSTFGECGPKPLDLLKKSGVPFVLNPTGSRMTEEGLLKFAQGCAGIIAGVEPYRDIVLNQLSNLKCISRCGVGVDNIDLVKAQELGIKILNTPDPVIVPVAELTLGMMLDLLRHISWHTQSLRKGQWQKKAGHNLHGKTVGIIGLGRIGKKVAGLLKAFEVRLMASDPFADKAWAVENNVTLASTEKLLRNSDIVTLHLGVDKNAPFFLDQKQIRLMKPGAFLLNLSRGQLVDEQALCVALADGHLAGAGVDVFSKEPYEGKLSVFENVIMTPHIATLTVESRLDMETQAVENLLAEIAR